MQVSKESSLPPASFQFIFGALTPRCLSKIFVCIDKQPEQQWWYTDDNHIAITKGLCRCSILAGLCRLTLILYTTYRCDRRTVPRLRQNIEKASDVEVWERKHKSGPDASSSKVKS